MTAHNLQPFKDLVSQRCGLSCDGVAEANLVSALALRMKATASRSASGYFILVSGDEDEFHELVALLTVNETYFFREPAQLTLAADILIPRLLSGRADDRPVRILSAGCSTGEEPYSLAMALREKFGESAGHLVSITAVDIDRQALASARRAEYGEFSFRVLSPELRDRHFLSKPPNRYRLSDAVRSLVDFSHLNLLDPLSAKALCGFDLVFYRNVSIYFDADSRKTILNNLHGAMNDTGVLLLGVSETLANDLGIFRLVEEGGSFYFAKAAASPPPAVAPKRLPPKPRPPGKLEQHAVRPAVVPRPVAGADWASVIATIRALLRAKRHDEALQAIRAQGASADPRLPLLEGHVRLQMRQFAEAAAIGEQAIAADSWSCDAHMLLALAAKWQGDTAAAIRSLKVIVYAKPNCWPAHYYLATLLHDLDAAKARREYAAALRQIDADPDPDGGLWLPLDLPVADIRFLCEHHSAAAEASTPRQAQSGGP